MLTNNNEFKSEHIIVYRTNDGETNIQVNVQDETIRLNVYQMADLFDKKRPTIVEHISNVFGEEELSKESTCRKIRQVQKEGKRNISRENALVALTLLIAESKTEEKRHNHQMNCKFD